MIIGNGGHAKVIKSFHQDWIYGSIIAVGDNAARKKEAEACKGIPFGVAIHPSAIVFSDVVIGEGTVIMAGVIVQPGARIGKHVILNTGATIDHGCVIEDFAHIAPGVNLCGDVKVGEGSLVGVGVAIAPGAVIPPWTLVKARRLELEALSGH